MERSDSSDWTLKRWSHRTVTHFKTAYSWTVGPFPTLDQSSSKSNQEKILSPKISVPGHDLQLQMTLQFCSKEAEANNQQEVVRFGLHCYQGEEIVSEVTVLFALNFYLGSVSRPYGLNAHIFNGNDERFSYLTTLDDFRFGNRTTLNQMEQLEVSLNLAGGYTKATEFYLTQMALLKSGTLSDFTVVVGDEPIPVHKALLAGRSPVFAAMFRHEDTKEAREGKVVIRGVRPQVFKDLLQFLYTGERLKVGRLTPELLILADKYQVSELKQDCELVQSTFLSVGTAVHSFRYADTYNAAALRESSLKFIAAHFPLVAETDAWEAFCKSGNGDLLVEVTRAVASNIEMVEIEE